MVYKTPCSNFNKEYIGHSTTDLKTGKPKVKHNTALSSRVKHMKHEIDFDKISLVHRNYHKFKLRDIEAIYINLNRD